METKSLLIHIFGDFNAGWLHFTMGLPCPSEPVMREGWMTASETPSLLSMRYVMEAQHRLRRKQRQYKVTTPKPVPLITLWHIIEAGSECTYCMGSGTSRPEQGCFNCRGTGKVPITRKDFLQQASDVLK